MLDLRTILILSLISLNLLFAAAGPTTIQDAKTETTTSGSIIIRRKSSSSRTSGGRLSLMNNRFSKRPRKKNLDPDQLLEILGSYYDPEWMSIEEPLPLANKDPYPGATYVIKEDGWQQAELVKQLKWTNLSMELAKASGFSDFNDSGLVREIEKWLLKKASCPVRYIWEDIGALFWPRYIRRGECFSVPGTCSWPPGMHCVPSGTTNLHVLRWQCKIPKGKSRRKNFKKDKELKNKEWQKNVRAGDQTINLKCSWIRVPYPITNECLCTC